MKEEKIRKFFNVLFKRKLVLISAVGLAAFVLIAVFAPLISPTCSIFDP